MENFYKGQTLGPHANTECIWWERVIGLTISGPFVLQRFHVKYFPLSQTGDAAYKKKGDVIMDWYLGNSTKYVRNNNVRDMVKGMRSLQIELNGLAPDAFMDPDSYHVRCMTHVINLVVNKSMLQVHRMIETTRHIVSAMRASVKRRDLFESLRKEINLTCDLSNLDHETRWSSTFVLIKSALCGRRALEAVVNGLERADCLWNFRDRMECSG